MYIVKNRHIEIVDHKFLVAGHSYVQYNEDFGHIEKTKKKIQFVFVPDDWVTAVASAHPKCKDLQSLLEFVPPIHHNYYQNVIHGKKEKKKKQQPKPSTSTTPESEIPMLESHIEHDYFSRRARLCPPFLHPSHTPPLPYKGSDAAAFTND
ncbi:hypothetical protein J6590_051501 [Homalodisca vitripennis]|nr:hypothetical protein J6590_051501 [Homalodisca vitripennis]